MDDRRQSRWWYLVSRVTESSHSPNYSWFAPNLGSTSDLRLTLASPVPISDNGIPVFLSFWHRYSFEQSFDGGVVEISTDGGQTWEDAGPLMTDNLYHGFIEHGFGNPLAGRSAFTGTSFGDPAFIQTRVDLSDLAGEEILIRFRIGTDSGFGGGGWHIDDIRVTQVPESGPDPGTVNLFSDDLEQGASAWTTEGSQGLCSWTFVSDDAHSETRSFRAPDCTSWSDQLLTLVDPIPIPASVSHMSLSFWHHFHFFMDHGGVVEISRDGGLNWLDAGSWMIKNRYDGIVEFTSDGPLAGRAAFTGGTDTWRRTVVDLTTFRGESIIFRFRLGTDSSGGFGSWTIDDITVEAEGVSDRITTFFSDGSDFVNATGPHAVVGFDDISPGSAPFTSDGVLFPGEAAVADDAFGSPHAVVFEGTGSPPNFLAIPPGSAPGCQCFRATFPHDVTAAGFDFATLAGANSRLVWTLYSEAGIPLVSGSHEFSAGLSPRFFGLISALPFRSIAVSQRGTSSDVSSSWWYVDDLRYAPQ